jgi:hypothetical protein
MDSLEVRPMSVNDEVNVAIRNVIVASVPERTEELSAMWDAYSPVFRLTEDRPGFRMQASPYGILFTTRTMHVIWLLGFAAWKAVYSYGAVFLVSRVDGEFDASKWIDLPDQRAADASFDEIMDGIKRLLAVEQLDDYVEPLGVPEAHLGKPKDDEGSVVFDLNCMAAAYVFLHEIRHIQLKKDKPDFCDTINEELECDRFAQATLTGRLEEFVRQSDQPLGLVRTKRAMSIALASFLLLVVTPESAWGTSRSHPSVSKRMFQLAQDLSLPDNDTFWNYLSCLILSQLRYRQAMPAPISISSERDLCLKLIDHLAQVS